MDDLVKRIAALEAKNEKLEKELATLKAGKAADVDDAGIPKDRTPQPKIDWTEGMRLPPSAVKAMAAVVPDVKTKPGFDAAAWARNKGPAAPSGFGPPKEPRPSEPPVRGSGFVGPPKPQDRTKQFERFDAMVESMVGGPNDTSKLK